MPRRHPRPQARKRLKLLRARIAGRNARPRRLDLVDRFALTARIRAARYAAAFQALFRRP